MLSDEQLELRATFRRFAEREIAPHAAEADERSEYPWKSFAAYRDSGFVRSPIPEEYGGDGADTVTYAMLVEEMARVCASSALFVIISKARDDAGADVRQPGPPGPYVPRVATGELQASYCLSEPDAGSDVASMSARAVRDGDHYVLRGTKAWITNAGVCDLYVVFAKTDPEAGHRGISAFVVERDTPGLSIGEPEQKMGMRGSPTCELYLDDAVVPGRQPHRRGREGLQLCDGRARLVATPHRRPGARHRPGRARRGDRLRRGATSVRSAHRRLPGRAVHPRRHGDTGGGGAVAPLRGLRAPRRRRSAGLEDRVDVEALRMRHRDAGDHGRGPALRRRRLHAAVPGRAHDAGREAHPDLRGHEPGAAGRRRRRATSLDEVAGRWPSVPRALLARPHRRDPRRQRADSAVQLAVRTTCGRPVHPPHRGHGPRAHDRRRDRGRAGHDALARARLGRRARCSRANAPISTPKRSTGCSPPATPTRATAPRKSQARGTTPRHAAGAPRRLRRSLPRPDRRGSAPRWRRRAGRASSGSARPTPA